MNWELVFRIFTSRDLPYFCCREISRQRIAALRYFVVYRNYKAVISAREHDLLFIAIFAQALSYQVIFSPGKHISVPLKAKIFLTVYREGNIHNTSVLLDSR